MDRLKQIQAAIDQQSAPPVHLWNVDHVEPIDMHIDAQGNWFYLGTPIARKKLAKLFSSVLWHEEGQHYLVTPIEKLSIKVDDVPFIVESAELVEHQWFVTTNMQDKFLVGAEHSVELRSFNDVFIPYVNIRYDIWARVNRNVYYQWVSTALDQQSSDSDKLLLSSGDYSFEVGR